VVTLAQKNGSAIVKIESPETKKLRGMSMTTAAVTTPMLPKVVRSDKLQPSKLVTHRFAMNDIMKPYDTDNAFQLQE
jgi:hypothetical protein